MRIQRKNCCCSLTTLILCCSSLMCLSYCCSIPVHLSCFGTIHCYSWICWSYLRSHWSCCWNFGCWSNCTFAVWVTFLERFKSTCLMVNFSQLFYLMTRVRLSERYQVSHIITLIGTFQRHKTWHKLRGALIPLRPIIWWILSTFSEKGFYREKRTSPSNNLIIIKIRTGPGMLCSECSDVVYRTIV